MIPYNNPISSGLEGPPNQVPEHANLHPYHPLNDLYLQEEMDLELFR